MMFLLFGIIWLISGWLAGRMYIYNMRISPPQPVSRGQLALISLLGVLGYLLGISLVENEAKRKAHFLSAQPKDAGKIFDVLFGTLPPKAERREMEALERQKALDALEEENARREKEMGIV